MFDAGHHLALADVVAFLDQEFHDPALGVRSYINVITRFNLAGSGHERGQIRTDRNSGLHRNRSALAPSDTSVYSAGDRRGTKKIASSYLPLPLHLWESFRVIKRNIPPECIRVARHTSILGRSGLLPAAKAKSKDASGVTIEFPMKLHSYTITQGHDRAPARAMLKAIGFTDEDLKKPIIGIANTWIETMPCNFNLRELAEHVKAGVRAAGGTPMEFNTIAISDGVTMGTEGMKASLVSRELIADSIELVARGHMFDGIVALVACDKTIPGAAMALLRLNIPGVVLYGGSIMPGRYKGRDLTIQDVFEAVGANAAGKMSDEEFLADRKRGLPGAGACGGQFTANTMATVMEMIGLAPMNTAAVPQVDPRKSQVAFRCGEVVMDAVRAGSPARGYRTREAFENAVASVAATGGSTNAVLHLLAMAREAEVEACNR